MIDQLVSQFMSSPQGQTAFSRLGAQGFAPNQAQAFMGAAVPTAAQSFLQAQRGGLTGARPGGPQGVLDIGNSHYVTNFLSGAVSSLVRGQGLMGAAVDGLQGVVGGHVAQVIATRFGLPQRVAGTVGAILTPLLIDWLWEKASGGMDLGAMLGGGGAQPQAPAFAGAPPVPTPTPGWGAGAQPPAPTPGWGGGAQVPQPTPGGGWGGGGGAVSPTVPGGLGALFNMFKG